MFDPNTLSGILGIASQDPMQAIGGVGGIPGMGQVPGQVAVGDPSGGMAGVVNPAAAGPAMNPMATMMGQQLLQQLMQQAMAPQAKAPNAPSGGTSGGGGGKVQTETKDYSNKPDPNAGASLVASLFGKGMGG